jgi:predicted PurR-regulated permease PerM
VAYYFLTDYGRFLNYVRRVIRPEGRARFDDLIHEIDASLRGYLAGQATLSLVMGVAAFLILSVNGVRPALVVGIAAAFLELIPVVGPLLWALVALILTYVQQPSHIVEVAVLLLIAHQTDMHILAPRILGGHLRLHPAVVIFALLAGNALMGILGVLLAAPLAATINTILTYLVTEGALSPAAVFRKETASSAAAPVTPPNPTQPANGSGAPAVTTRRGRGSRRR